MGTDEPVADPRLARDFPPEWWAHESRIRKVEWQLIGARQQAGDDERLAFWWGLVIGLWFAIFLTHYRIAFTRRGDGELVEQQGDTE